ncbi:MAG: peptidyl-tRNA hydrolase Pth2 [Candidatus Hadarchaeum sp.]|uniref:peptidyl-tRNA hydrolase Pth2 n=1 Tax=Candidatus Hadarchaeum sp. TaxID=2883567 RepID=UPI003D0CAC44
MFNYKQVIVVRTDLEMSPGKIAAQAAHGAVGAAEAARKKRRKWFYEWFSEGQKKVVVKVKNENELLELKKKADKLGLPNMLVVDAGLTELAPGTVTALGIGPAPNEELDQITGKLPLL